MELGLTFRNGQMTGEGRDWVGEFVIRAPFTLGDGKYWTKRYIGRHDVFYNGYNEGKGIWGVWEIVATDEYPGQRGGFHIWPEGMADPTGSHLTEEAEPPLVITEELPADPVEVPASTRVSRHPHLPRHEVADRATSSGRRCSRITGVRLVAGQPAEEVGVVEHPGGPRCDHAFSVEARPWRGPAGPSDRAGPPGAPAAASPPSAGWWRGSRRGRGRRRAPGDSAPPTVAGVGDAGEDVGEGRA